jgi:hypothetical protein
MGMAKSQEWEWLGAVWLIVSRGTPCETNGCTAAMGRAQHALRLSRETLLGVAGQADRAVGIGYAHESQVEGAAWGT